MDSFRIDLWDQSEYTYEQAYGFMPNIRAFLHDEDKEVRKCILVAPGGGYCMCAPHEGELVALEFYKKGLNAFVLTYTTDITFSAPLRDQPSKDIARAVRMIRKNADSYNVDPNKLVICGFSAAGHLCATLATHFADIKDTNPEYTTVSCRPDAVILGYPVITAGEYTHSSSLGALLGWNPTQEEKDYYSLEKCVTKDTPPCFIWQTLGDSLVPVENSYLFAEALRKNGVNYAQYVFPFGDHGLSIASFEQFKGWRGGEYSMEQVGKVVEHVKDNTLVNVSEQRKKELEDQFLNPDRKQEPPKFDEKNRPAGNPFADISMWPELAYIWMSRIL